MVRNNTGRGKTDWKRLERMGDVDIRRAATSDPDAAPVASPAWLRRAKLLEPQPKLPVSMRIDQDILQWFRARGRGYQTHINAVLRAYFEAHRSR